MLHGRQRREDDMGDAVAIAQAVGDRLARGDCAARRHLIDHIVDTEHDDRHIGIEQRARRQMLEALRARQPGSGQQPPLHAHAGLPGQRLGQVAGERLRLLGHTDAGCR